VYLVGQSKPAVKILQYAKWAHASACAHLYSGCCGPMRANNPNITVHEMGPFCGLNKRAFRLLWPNSTSLARSWQSHHRPMWATVSAAIPLTANNEGPCGSLIWQPIVCLMGQCKLVVQVTQYIKWAHASACMWLLSGCCGPTQACRPKQKSYRAAHFQLDGPMWTNCPNIMVYEKGPTLFNDGGIKCFEYWYDVFIAILNL